MKTANQPTAAPTRKVTAAGIGAILGTLTAAAMHASAQPGLLKFISYPGVEAALGGLFAVVMAYAIKERALEV